MRDAACSGPVERALHERFEPAGRAGRYQLWLPRGVEPVLVSSATRAYGCEALLGRHGAALAFALDLPPLAGARVARIAVHDAASGVDLLDSSGDDPARRLIVVGEDGESLLGAPGAAFDEPARGSRLWMLWPKVNLDHGAEWLFVRASDPAGHGVAWLLFQSPRRSP